MRDLNSLSTPQLEAIEANYMQVLPDLQQGHQGSPAVGWVQSSSPQGCQMATVTALPATCNKLREIAKILSERRRLAAHTNPP